MDYNPYLKPWRQPKPNQVAGKGSIEQPDKIQNIAWQTRPAIPTEYEIQLGDALETVFASGAESLDQVVAKLNELGMRTAEGRTWTSAVFESEMKKLGGGF